MALTTLYPAGKSTVCRTVRLTPDCWASAATAMTGATTAAAMSNFLSTGDPPSQDHYGRHANALPLSMIVGCHCGANVLSGGAEANPDQSASAKGDPRFTTCRHHRRRHETHRDHETRRQIGDRMVRRSGARGDGRRPGHPGNRN